jgi:hypothetical protein
MRFVFNVLDSIVLGERLNVFKGGGVVRLEFREDLRLTWIAQDVFHEAKSRWRFGGLKFIIGKIGRI